MNKLKSSKKLLVFLTVLVMLFAVNITVFAQNTWINDSAGLFSESDIDSLQKELGMAKLYLDADVMAVTSKDMQGKTSEVFCNEYLDSNGYGLNTGKNVILLLINTQANEMYIAHRGEKTQFLNDEKIEEILNNLSTNFSSGAYSQTITDFVALLKDSQNSYLLGIYTGEATEANEPQTSPVNPDTDTKKDEPSHIGVFIIISAAVAAFFCISVAAKYRMKIGGYKYPFREKSSLKLTQKTDILVSKNVTERRIKNDDK